MTGSMIRQLFSILLLIAVALSGIIPHAAMAGEPQKMSAQCHNDQTVMSGHAAAMEHCNVPDHSMSGACAIACLGSIVTLFPAPLPDPATVDFRPAAHPAVISLVLHGRQGETADRPPKSI